MRISWIEQKTKEEVLEAIRTKIELTEILRMMKVIMPTYDQLKMMVEDRMGWHQ